MTDAPPTTTFTLRCTTGCHDTRYPLFVPLFSCPRCGGLVDVDCDDDAALPELDVGRRRAGLWRYRSWVAPDLDDDDIVSLGEGDGPLVPLHDVGNDGDALYDCGRQPTGSFKDFGMTVLVSFASAMKQRGQDVRVLVCASTGDTSAALAAYGARAQIPVAVIVPRGKISDVQLVQPQAHGAHVVAVDADFDGCMRVVQDLARTPGVYLANSKNPLRLLGQSTVAFDIVHKLGRAPDFVLVPSGNLGNVAALYRGFRVLLARKRIERMPRLVACQVDAANPLHASWSTWQASAARASTSPQKTSLTAGETHATAIRIGDPVSFPRAVRALQASNGLTTSTSEPALLAAMARADRAGFFVCPQTAAALDGLAQLRDRGVIDDHHTAVVVATASGLKFATQKAQFHAGSTALGDLPLPQATAALRNPIAVVDASAAAVARTLGLAS